MFTVDLKQQYNNNNNLNLAYVKPKSNSLYMNRLVNTNVPGFVYVKTCLLIACDTNIYAIIYDNSEIVLLVLNRNIYSFSIHTSCALILTALVRLMTSHNT